MQEVLTFVQGFCVGALVPIGGFLIYLKQWEHKDSERRDNEAAKKKASIRAKQVQEIGFTGDVTKDNQWMKDSLAQEAAKIAASTGE